MKKIILILVLLVCVLVAAVSCGENDATTGREDNMTTNETTAQVTTAADTTAADTTAADTTAADTTAADTTADVTTSPYKMVANPVYKTASDPWVVEHDGSYYYCFSRGNGVAVNKIASIDKITERNYRTVYTAPSGTMYSGEYWAPELHYINGKWYIYVAADDGKNENHRMFVLEGTTQDPTDKFVMKGKITDASDKWAIDGTVLQHDNGELYFIWSGWEGDENNAQNLYIAHMSDPLTIDSERVLISKPEYPFELYGGGALINEGPTVLQHDGKLFIVYSASGSWCDEYCLGMLTYTGGDLLDIESWEKSTFAVFKKRNQVAYGTGHCSFAPAPDGSIWMIYHANPDPGKGWGGRTCWIGAVKWDDDGNPIFGKPQSTVLFPR